MAACWLPWEQEALAWFPSVLPVDQKVYETGVISEALEKKQCEAIAALQKAYYTSIGRKEVLPEVSTCIKTAIRHLFSWVLRGPSRLTTH